MSYHDPLLLIWAGDLFFMVGCKMASLFRDRTLELAWMVTVRIPRIGYDNMVQLAW